MVHHLFAEYAPILRCLNEAELREEIALPSRLRIDADVVRGRNLQIAYAPFDYINPNAQIVIVGLTPGRQQMGNALLAAWRSLKEGASDLDTIRQAKVFASFSGPMRTNLVALLDHIGVHDLCGVTSTATLWTHDHERVHFTSALRYPAFIDGQNYSGNPAPLSTPLLSRHLMTWLAGEMRALPNALFVPLGPIASECVKTAAKHVNFSDKKILSGLPHPSGANAERIAYFLGRKARSALSTKVNPTLIDEARRRLVDVITQLKGETFSLRTQ